MTTNDIRKTTIKLSGPRTSPALQSVSAENVDVIYGYCMWSTKRIKQTTYLQGYISDLCPSVCCTLAYQSRYTLQVCTVQRAAGMRRHLVSEIVTKFFLAHASKIHAHTPLTFFVTSAILHPHIGTYSLIWFLSKSTPFKAVMQVWFQVKSYFVLMEFNMHVAYAWTVILSILFSLMIFLIRY